MPRNSQALLEHHDRIVLGDNEYRINNSHKVYIRAVKIMRSKDIFEEDKRDVLVPLLFKDEIPAGSEDEAIKAFFDLFTSSSKSPSSDKASFDMVEDARYIFAGFMQTYHIDLEDGDMPIEKFVALLQGLPSDTKLADIIRIRTMPIPKVTKYNSEQINDILRAKAKFALKEGDESPWSGFGKMIKEWAKHGR